MLIFALAAFRDVAGLLLLPIGMMRVPPQSSLSSIASAQQNTSAPLSSHLLIESGVVSKVALHQYAVCRIWLPIRRCLDQRRHTSHRRPTAWRQQLLAIECIGLVFVISTVEKPSRWRWLQQTRQHTPTGRKLPVAIFSHSPVVADVIECAHATSWLKPSSRRRYLLSTSSSVNSLESSRDSYRFHLAVVSEVTGTLAYAYIQRFWRFDFRYFSDFEDITI